MTFRTKLNSHLCESGNATVTSLTLGGLFCRYSRLSFHSTNSYCFPWFYPQQLNFNLRLSRKWVLVSWTALFLSASIQIHRIGIQGEMIQNQIQNLRIRILDSVLDSFPSLLKLKNSTCIHFFVLGRFSNSHFWRLIWNFLWGGKIGIV